MILSPATDTPGNGENGFTVVELLVTMTVALIVLFAALQAGDIFASTSKKASDRVSAQDTARATVRQAVQELRQARLPSTTATTPVLRATSSGATQDLVFATRSGAGADTFTRLCVTSDGQSLLLGRLTAPYADPATTCSVADTTGGWSYGAIVSGTLRNASALLSFDSGSCVGGLAVAGPSVVTPGAACTVPAGAITTVGLRIAVASKPADTAASSVVTDAVNLRNGAIS